MSRILPRQVQEIFFIKSGKCQKSVHDRHTDDKLIKNSKFRVKLGRIPEAVCSSWQESASTLIVKNASISKIASYNRAGVCLKLY